MKNCLKRKPNKHGKSCCSACKNKKPSKSFHVAKTILYK